MTTRFRKGPDGWQARTEIGLPTKDRVLVISTHKTSSGLVTHNMINTKVGNLLQWEMFGDFSKRLVHTGTRCTEKTVRDLHQQALDVQADTIAEADAFYAKKEAAWDFTTQAVQKTKEAA